MSTQLRLSLATGFLLGITYPSAIVPAWIAGWLSLIAFVPLLVLFSSGRELLPKVIHLYLAMAIFHGVANWWVGSYQEQTDPFLLASGIALMIGHPLFLMLPWVALRYVRRRLSSVATLAIAPLLFTAFEWLHGQTDASYPWLSIGYALVDTPLVHLADAVGVYGLGFLILCVNAAIVAAITLPRTRNRLAVGTALLCAAWIAYGLHSANVHAYSEQREQTSRPLRVALVQSNDNPWDKWTSPIEQADRTRRFSQHKLDSLQQNTAIDLLVWPETAIPYPIRHPQYAEQWSQLLDWCNARSISLLTGLSDIYTYPSGAAPASARTSESDPTLRYDIFNAAALIANTNVDVHYKTNLTPFAERLPFVDQLVFAQSWFQWGVGISSWGKGSSRTPLALRRDGEDYRIGVIICIESIYPEMVRDLVRNGASVLCVITNDAWYNGTPGPRQHYQIARLRAIEQRRWLFRCALSGVTGVIAPDGTSVAEIPAVTASVLSGIVFNQHHQTMYAVIGDVVPVASVVLAFAALFWAGVRGVVDRRSPASHSSTES